MATWEFFGDWEVIRGLKFILGEINYMKVWRKEWQISKICILQIQFDYYIGINRMKVGQEELRPVRNLFQ
jgi:hypothetical protein